MNPSQRFVKIGVARILEYLVYSVVPFVSLFFSFAYKTKKIPTFYFVELKIPKRGEGGPKRKAVSFLLFLSSPCAGAGTYVT